MPGNLETAAVSFLSCSVLGIVIIAGKSNNHNTTTIAEMPPANTYAKCRRSFSGHVRTFSIKEKTLSNMQNYDATESSTTSTPSSGNAPARHTNDGADSFLGAPSSPKSCSRTASGASGIKTFGSMVDSTLSAFTAFSRSTAFAESGNESTSTVTSPIASTYSGFNAKATETSRYATTHSSADTTTAQCFFSEIWRGDSMVNTFIAKGVTSYSPGLSRRKVPSGSEFTLSCTHTRLDGKPARCLTVRASGYINRRSCPSPRALTSRANAFPPSHRIVTGI